jgi:DNA-3-methyladenine glycosylase II
MSATLQLTSLEVRGPYDLAEVALMGFGHRDETQFDGVMRMAFCLDGGYERTVGVEARQRGGSVELTMHSAPGSSPLSPSELERAMAQVARVISLDHDGVAFDLLCRADAVLAPVHARAPGFRPALFYSPYEAAVWSVLSARRARGQAIGLRARLAEKLGTTFHLAGVATPAIPTPGQLGAVDSFPGLPADRIPRLHAIAAAAQRGELEAGRLRGLDPHEAMADLQRLPGIGPFYSALIVVRACGHADAIAPGEAHSRQAAGEAYGFDHDLDDAEFTELAERWRPYRTWVSVMLRALAGREAP